MKFSVEAKVLSQALAVTSKVVERRNTIPILSNILLRAEEGKLTLRSTDLDIEMTVPIAAEVEEPGATTVPASLIFDITRKLNSGAVVFFEMEADGQMLKASAGRSRFKLQCLPEGDFPTLDVGDFSTTIELPGRQLAKAMSKVQFAISTEETRYYLNGIYAHAAEIAGKPNLVLVATDGHRLAKATIQMDFDLEMPGVIIPRKAVSEIIRLSDSAGDDTVSLQVSSAKIRFTAGEIVMNSKLIDGTFPDYQRVIPEPSNTVAMVDVKEVAKAADRVATISTERGRAVKFSFSPGQLKLEVNNVETGSAVEELAVDYDGDPMEIGFNSRYVAEILSNVGSGTARISLQDAGSPTRVTKDDDDSFIYVLMPMRI